MREAEMDGTLTEDWASDATGTARNDAGSGPPKIQPDFQPLKISLRRELAENRLTSDD
jgi:hypothetical protein